MADKLTVGELVYKISGDMENLQTELKKSEAEISKLKDAMEQSTTTSGKMNKSFETAGKVVKTFIAAFAVKEVINFGKEAVAQAQALIEQQTKLAQVLRVSQNATDAQIDSMIKYADELEKVGIIDKESILAAEAQLATYDLSTDSIKTLTPALLDYLAAEKGSNATKEDAISITNGLAQAIQGNYSSLSRTGFILDEATKNTIEHGTQEERVAAITEVLNSTYQDYNKTLLDQNPQKAATRALGNFKEALGLSLLPAIQTLSKELLMLSGDFGESGIDIEAWGKAFYRVAQGIVVIAKVFKEAFLGIKIVWNGLENTFIGGAEVIITALRLAAKAVGKDTTTLDQALVDLADAFKKNLDDIGDAGDESTKNMDGMMENLKQIWSADGYQAVAAKARTAFDENKKAIDDFGASTEDTAASSEKLQEKLLGVRDTLLKTSDDLNSKVTDAFKKFNETIGSSLDDTDSKLAGTFLDAQDKIKDLKKQLSEVNPSDSNSAKQQTDLQNQIADQEKILSSRQGFEERQAATIQAIRDKLTAAGIDAEKEGLTNLINVKSLEDQIKDERALRDLDDFAREEELQKRRLLDLTDNLIAEVTALREKITQQEELEAELTDFLVKQNTLRKADVDKFANAAIAKYGEMANALKNAISLQNSLNALRSGGGTTAPQFASGGYVGAKGGEVHPGEYVIPANLVQRFAGAVSAIDGVRTGSNVTNNSNVNAPISINGNFGEQVDANALAKEIAWELGSR